MILWLLLYTHFALAQDSAIEEYCFSSVGKMKDVSARLKFILVPADKTQEDKNCFTVSTPVHRRELIQSYVRRLEPGVQIAFSSAEIKKDPCHLKVEKIKTKSQQALDGSLTTRLTPSIGTDQTTTESKETTTIQTLKGFELTVNQIVIKGECRAINPTRYEITIEVRKDPIPLLPPLPPGTIVVVPDAQIPKLQETSRLQTTLQLNSGDRIEIGSIVTNLKNGAKGVDINSGGTIEQNDGSQNEKVFLSLY